MTSRRHKSRQGSQRGPAQPVGSLYGYQLLVSQAEFENPFEVHRWKVPAGLLETDDPEAVFVARTSFSLDSIVSMVAQITAIRERDRSSFESMILKDGLDPRLAFVRFLLRRLVTTAIARRVLPDPFTDSVPTGWLLKGEQVLLDVAAVRDRNANERDKWSIHSMGMRVMQAQYHDQLDYFDYKRELWLTRRIVSRATDLGVNVEEAYRQLLGFHTLS